MSSNIDIKEKEPSRCPVCIGSGLVRTPTIECPTCLGHPRGCYKCKAGYIQLSWSECEKCFGLGSIEKKKEIICTTEHLVKT